MLTAAEVRRYVTAADEGVRCAATVGLSHPVFAAAPSEEAGPVGTINTFCWVPEPLRDAALVNLVVTATEAKTQALTELGVPGTGTASDAIVIACPDGTGARFGGPRSLWGARLARAVHAATLRGAREWAGPAQPVVSCPPSPSESGSDHLSAGPAESGLRERA
jgi:adenosylcobinamide hydrolase